MVVLPQRCAPLSPGSIPGLGAVHAFGFKSILASAGFSSGSLVFLLHLKLSFLKKYISGNIAILSHLRNENQKWRTSRQELEVQIRTVERMLDQKFENQKVFSKFGYQFQSVTACIMLNLFQSCDVTSQSYSPSVSMAVIASRPSCV